MKLSSRTKKNILISMAGLLVTIAAGFAYIQQPLFCRSLNNKIYDIMLRKVHNSITSGVPVIVDIDEESLRDYGQWPWPRYRTGMLLSKIGETGALAVGIDILFAEPDRSSPLVIQDEMNRDMGLDIDFTGLPDTMRDNDKILADTLADGPYVLGYFFNFGEEAPTIFKNSLHPVNDYLAITPSSVESYRYLIEPDGVSAPLPELAEAAGRSGYFNTIPDEDGILRSVPLLMSWKDNIYPSLALATLLTALNETGITLNSSGAGIESLVIGDTEIPLDRHGRLLIHYRGAHHIFQHISASDILSGKIGAGDLSNKIVLIGTSAAGLTHLWPTPVSSGLPGIEIHATAIDNILRGDFFSRPDWAPGLEFVLIILSGLIISIMIAFSSAKWTAPITLVGGAAMWQCGVWFLASERIFVSTLFPILSLVGNFTLLTLMKFIVSESEKRFLRGAFSRYVSKSVVDQIADAPESLNLEGEEKELSMLFSDIRGFTSLSEQLRPTEVIKLLQDYFTPMTTAITRNEGTLDKFIGDAIMAFWNAPLEVTEHKEKCLKAGVYMLQKLGQLNKVFKKKYGFEINIGIGVHAGIVRVGNIGTADLFDYTIIGDDVNLASRLEGLTKYYGVRIILSERMTGACPPGFKPQELDLVSVKGKNEPIRIYGLYSGHYAKHPDSELPLYQEALEAYRARDFNESLALFSTLYDDYANRKLYQLYQGRCESFLKSPPPDDWDMVFRHTSK